MRVVVYLAAKPRRTDLSVISVKKSFSMVLKAKGAVNGPHYSSSSKTQVFQIPNKNIFLEQFFRYFWITRQTLPIIRPA
jgi:hypothetical protein